MSKTGGINTHASQQGVVILEALIAILIFSMGILAVVGLQAAMIKNSGVARDRVNASFIARQQVGMIWSNPDDMTAFLEPEPGTDISSQLPQGRRVTVQTAPGEFLVTITWTPPGQTGSEITHSYSTTARVCNATGEHC